jgi:hypothetical protein
MRLKEFAEVDRESRKGWDKREEAARDMLKLSVDHEPFRRPVGSPPRQRNSALSALSRRSHM